MREVDAVGAVLARVGAAPDVIVGQWDPAQVRDDGLDPAVHRRADQVDLVAVGRVAPHPAGEDVRPHEDALWEDAFNGGQILLDGGQEASGAVGAQVIAAQVYDEDVWVGPGNFQLVELRQKLGPRHALSALPPDGHLVGVHAQLHTYLWGPGPWLGPVHQGVATDPNVLGLAADRLSYEMSENKCQSQSELFPRDTFLTGFNTFC